MTAREEGDVGRVRVIFHGHVQGVFFRATSEEIARGFAVVGFVRNLADGTVELEAQGAADEVSRFIEAIQQRYRGNITRTERTDLRTESGEHEFRVRY